MIYFKTIFILIITVSFLSGCSSKYEKAQKYYSNGKKYFDAGETELARIEFLNAIQRDPSYADAYFHLGLIAKSQGRVEIVYEMMMKASKLDATNTRAVLNVAELMLLGRQFDLALEQAELLIQQNAHLFDAYRLQAAAYVGQKAYGQADIALKKANEIKENDASLYGLRAIIARDRGKLEESLFFLEKAIDQGVDQEHYFLLRSKIHRDMNNLISLRSDLIALVSLSPGQKEYVFALAKINVKLKEFEEAERVLLSFMERQPENYAAMQLYLDVVYLVDRERANSTLHDWISRFDSSNALRFYKARRELREGNVEKGKEALNSVIKRSADKDSVLEDMLKARAMLAEVLLKQEKIDEASSLLFENRKLNESHEETLLVLSDHDIRTKNFETAIANLHRVLRKNPNSEKALLLLGQAYVENGSDLLADDAFRNVLEINPTNQFAAIPVAKTLIRSEDLERSENVIERVLSKNPEDAKLIMFYIRVLLLKEDWMLAERAIAMLQDLPNTAAQAAHLKGALLQAQKRYDEAILSYQEALRLKPSLLPALKALQENFQNLEQEREFLKYLERYSEANPNSLHAYALGANVYLGLNEYQSAIASLKKALALNIEWEEGYVQLAGIHNTLQNFAAAEEAYRLGISALPESAYLKTLLASFLESRGMKSEALKQYAHTIDAHPEFLIARNNYVSLLLAESPTDGQLVKALELSELLRTREEAHFQDTYGLALLMNNRPQEAEVVLRAAAEKAPKLIEIQLHFAQALFAVERYQEANVVLKRTAKYGGGEGAIAGKIAALQKRLKGRLAGLSDE